MMFAWGVLRIGGNREGYCFVLRYAAPSLSMVRIVIVIEEPFGWLSHHSRN